jgi:hypothetical protein
LLMHAPSIGAAEIIWSGDYEEGYFTQWHIKSDKNHPQFAGIPEYGRPVVPDPNLTSADSSYMGNGDLAALVTDPVRQGSYAVRFTVKNSANGSEPADCDNGNCDRRRSELNMHLVSLPVYGAMQYLEEYWVSTSYFVPSDWDNGGSGWGPLVFQIKPKNQGGGIGPTFHIRIENGEWILRHTWTDEPNCQCKLPWQQQMDYSSDILHADLLADFPDRAVSEAALADLNKGGWTDWVMNVRWDARGKGDGGTGFMDVWKRADEGEWIHVLHIVPRVVSIGDMTFDRGVGQNATDSGFGPLAGMYMHKDQVWSLRKNRVIYNDNLKIGSANTKFEEMSPDGSAPGITGVKQESPPKPPELVSN